MRMDDDLTEEAEIDDEEAALADDVLDEVADDTATDELDTEGFGLLPEPDEEEEKTEEEELPDEESLEEDAEDVDYDTFDDVDEM